MANSGPIRDLIASVAEYLRAYEPLPEFGAVFDAAVFDAAVLDAAVLDAAVLLPQDAGAGVDVPAVSFGTSEDALSHPFLRSFEAAKGELTWRQNRTYFDTEFLKRYAYTELLGPSGLVVCDSVSAGLLVLAPDTFYPPHAHPAEEIYHVISGASEWQQGDRPAVVREPGARVQHASAEAHSMCTGAEALLALYLWRGDLQSPARFVASR